MKLPTCQEADLEYVKTLDDYANAKGASITMGNPGTDIPRAILE